MKGYIKKEDLCSNLQEELNSHREDINTIEKKNKR